MVTHITTMGGDVGLILLKSPYAFSSYMPSFGEKDQDKTDMGALSVTPTPPGVDRESKLSNMFVFDFAFPTAMKFNFVVSGIPVHGRVMKPRFQNMES